MNNQQLKLLISQTQTILNELNRLYMQETADTAQWEQIGEYDNDNNAEFRCSHCNHTDTHAKGVVVPYCWNCGSKMSKKEDCLI